MLRLLRIFNRREFAILMSLALYSTLSGILELISIGTLMPVLYSLTNPKMVQSQLAEFGVSIADGNLIFVTLLSFVCILTIASGFKIFALSQNFLKSQKISHLVNVRVLQCLFTDDVRLTLTHEDSKYSALLTTKSDTFTHNFVQPMIIMASNLIILFLILSFILWLDIYVFLIIVVPVLISYYIIRLLTRKKNLMFGEALANSQQMVAQGLIQITRGLDELIIYRQLETELKKLKNYDLNGKESRGWIQVFANSPRYIIETTGIIFLIIALFYRISVGGITDAIPVIATMTFALQRTLPMINQVYSSYNVIKASFPVVEEFYNILDKERMKIEDQNVADFSKIYLEIEKWPNSTKPIIENFSMSVGSSDKIAILGPSGCGKSSIIKMFAGLIDDFKGQRSIDGIPSHNLFNLISYVPQKPYIMAGSIADNVTFGETNKDDKALTKLVAALELDTLPIDIYEKHDNLSKLLSGGQQQRIAIARALYSRRKILMFDEATSALDERMSSIVLDLILSDNNNTVLYITHRSNEAGRFDKALKLQCQ